MHNSKMGVLKAVIREGLNEESSLLELRNEIVKFRDAGGPQDEARLALYALRDEFADNEQVENIRKQIVTNPGGLTRQCAQRAHSV